MLYGVKNPSGKLIDNGYGHNKIDAIINACCFDNDLENIVVRDSWNDDATRKRVYRAGYTVVPVKMIEIKG